MRRKEDEEEYEERGRKKSVMFVCVFFRSTQRMRRMKSEKHLKSLTE